MNASNSLFLLAAAGGCAVTLQAAFMGLMDRQIGSLESVFITYVSGGIVIAVILLARGGGNLGAWHTVPRYALLSGVLGLIIVGSIGYAVPRIGLATAFTLIIAAQFALGAVVDHFGWFGTEVQPFTLGRLAGIGLLLLGTWLLVRPSA